MAIWLLYGIHRVCFPYSDSKISLKDSGMWQVYREIELPLIFTLDSMEKYGICVKGEELKTYGKKLQVRIEELEKHDLGGRPEKNSTSTLRSSSERSCSKKWDFREAERQRPVIPQPQISLRNWHRNIQSSKISWNTASLRNSNPLMQTDLSAVIEPDGRIHSTFNQTITATGRISSTEPNLQNIPVQYGTRTADPQSFCAGGRIMYFWMQTTRRFELRVLAHMSGDEKLDSGIQRGAGHPPPDSVSGISCSV